MSHTFDVTASTFWCGIGQLVVITFLFWIKFRRRTTCEPRWLRNMANFTLAILSIAFLVYLLGVATWYE
jgi:NhaP-type Na+/H+ or K+/H+ antiporter